MLDDDTTPTEEDGLLDQLRRDGVIGPFRVADWAGASDVGLVRDCNEDAWDTSQDRLFVVADGLGGHDGGEIASEAAIAAMVGVGLDFTEAEASTLVAQVNDAVLEAGRTAGVDGLGTTLVALAAHRTHVVVLNVGDSRAYRHREGELELLTEDHTVRNELLASGVPLEVAEQSKVRLDALTSHLGRAAERLARQVASFSVMSGDRFLLCTDGVHGQMTHADIADRLATGDCRQAVVSLLEWARASGGRDNATAIIIDFEREGE